MDIINTLRDCPLMALLAISGCIYVLTPVITYQRSMSPRDLAEIFGLSFLAGITAGIERSLSVPAVIAVTILIALFGGLTFIAMCGVANKLLRVETEEGAEQLDEQPGGTS